MLGLGGANSHKWDHIRSFLQQRVVQDDDLHRAWFVDESMSQGLLFACQQGQVDMGAVLGECRGVWKVWRGIQGLV